MTKQSLHSARTAAAPFIMPAAGMMLAMLLLLCMLLAPRAALADNLASMRNTELPTLPVKQTAARFISLEGRLLALTDDRSWLLSEDRKSWTALEYRAPYALASAAGEKQSYLISGSAGAMQVVSKVERLKLRNSTVEASDLPPLPPLTQAFAAALGDKLYVAGYGASGAPQLLALDTAAPGASWETLPAWDGKGASISSLAAQNSSVLLTLRGAEGQGDRLLRWKARTGWEEMKPVPGAVLPGAARATGQAHVLYLARPAGKANAAPELHTYHTITGSWAVSSIPPGAPEAAAQQSGELAAGWANGLLHAYTGADGSQHIAYTEIVSGKRLLKTFDWFVIVAYLAGMLGIGWYCYIREKRNSTSDFFVGGRSIPFWAAGISLYAANTSSISYIAIPAKAFETNWQYMTNNLVAVVALTFVAVAVVPLLRRLDLMSVFHYLEIRFHPSIRMIASLICILVQIGSRMSVILLLPSLAIATITGIDVTWSIIIMGGFTIIYTAMGGMKAVVWTDFVQLFVKMGGALFAIGFIIWKLDGGVMEFVNVAAAESKTKLFDFSWDLTQPTVWGFIFLVLFDVVLTFPKDQVLMQRVLSTKSAKEATRSIWTFAAISIPGGFIFYTIGTALYTYYKSHPERMNPLLNVDATFPLFIAAELPTGITGLIIAGILAAAMATLSGIMNSVATLASVDFYEKLVKNPTPKKSVVFAEAATVATGLIGIAAALLLSRFNAHSLFDVSIELAGLLSGGFAGAYTLGMFTRRANWQGVAIGIVCSSILTTVCWTFKIVHPYFYLPISIMLCIVFGYLASYLFPAPKQSLAGLTIYADKP
ncbi:sodium:solute symporter [Massilia endophytica]|uniref:sodium:solute symporter n=1 Tax=Massilia endophytica TaxID=2899220 RepID=UPI001E3E4261|nr:sodium:solute symporter [Massilia endophytica]UGQ46721.1 sodium:solute symporter [Massilia endophytica]